MLSRGHRSPAKVNEIYEIKLVKHYKMERLLLTAKYNHGVKCTCGHKVCLCMRFAEHRYEET